MIKANIAFARTDMLTDFLLRFGLIYRTIETREILDFLVRDVDLILAQNEDEKQPDIQILIKHME